METVAKIVLLLLFGVPGIVAIAAMAMTARGYVASILWGWFIVPGFGAPPISIPLAIGVSMLFGLWTNHRSWDEAKDPDKKWTPLVVLCISPPLALLIGWVVKQYM